MCSSILFNSVYVDLQYNEISLIFTIGYVCLCGVCSHVVIFNMPVRLFWCGECRGCGDSDTCAVDCIGCEYTVRVRKCEDDINVGVENRGGVVAVSMAYK